MRESKWYGLRIPEQDDEYNVDDFGAAFDKTDDALTGCPRRWRQKASWCVSITGLGRIRR